jgi:putative peptidoglycan lipid II flippase
VSYLQFANRFYQQPLSLIGIALATVLLPHLSRALKANKQNEANQSFQEALTYGSALAIFSSITLVMLAFPLIDSLFGHGEFTAQAAYNVAQAMQIYCLALPAYVMTKITVTCFYAAGDTKTPLLVSIFSLITNVTLNLILMQYYGFLGLAMATSIAGYVNAALQYALLYRKGYIRLNQKNLMQTHLIQMFIINLSVLVLLTVIHYTLSYDVQWSTVYQILYTGVVGLSALCTFVFLSHQMKFFNFFDIIHQIKSRKKKG